MNESTGAAVPSTPITSAAGYRCAVRLTGPIAAGDEDRSIQLGGPKQRALLAVLALDVGEIVPVSRLIELIWDGDPPRTAAHSIQIYVSELRKAFAAGGWPGVIETCPPGYRLALGPDQVDVHRIVSLVQHGLAAARFGDADTAAGSLRSALGMHRGAPLADFTDTEFAQPHIRRLHELRCDALEELAALELAAGDSAGAVLRARDLVADEPMRERAVDILMTALYRAGRHVQALHAYERHRVVLRDELGVVPSPALQRLNERILLHDSTLLTESPPGPSIGAIQRNPYKGLRPFREEDAEDHFGRDTLVAALVERLEGGERLLALVGPSGCGKSSAVAAGLIPALRAGAFPGSDTWAVATMVPGAQPRREAEAVIARAVAEARGAGPVSHGPHGVASGRRVLLVIDQFEELFAAADAAATRDFLDGLSEMVRESTTDVTVVLTLRADHYDQPLLHAGFAPAFTAGIVNVLPMTAAELHAAVSGPAAAVGIDVEPELAAELVAGVVDQPGSLPLLQYALTEQFERRSGDDLSLAGHRALGGLRAILSRRADAVYATLEPAEQDIAEHVMLRMVRVGRSTADAARRVPVAELTELALDPVALSTVLRRYAEHRLLAFDADPLTGRPTVSMAHEALLDGWDRLAGWIEQHRTTMRRHDALRSAAAEWDDSGRHADYLYAGVRLTEVEAWPARGRPVLTTDEQAFIDASLVRRREDTEADALRTSIDRRRTRHNRLRFGAVAAIAVTLGTTTVAALARDGSEIERVALVYHDTGEVSDLIEAGFDRGVAEFGFGSREVDALALDAGGLLDDVADDVGLVIDFTLGSDIEAVAARHVDTEFVVLDRVVSAPNVRSVSFADHQGSYLAGAAAALTTTTGTIGFIGGVDWPRIWRFQAGFEAGARAIDPDIRILTTYLAEPPDFPDGFLDPARGERAARGMYEAGADVLFAAAGTSGLGVFEAAAELSGPGRHLWAIGVDSDQFRTVADLAGTVAADTWTPHILTSVIKRFDMGAYATLAAHAADADRGVLGDVELGLVDGGIELSFSGGFIDAHRARLEGLRQSIIDGTVVVPCVPQDRIDDGALDACSR